MRKDKKQILDFLKTHTYKETSDKFDISEMTLSRWKKQLPLGNLEFALKKLLSYKNQTVRKYAKMIKHELGV
jgi:hypothetical protein